MWSVIFCSQYVVHLMLIIGQGSDRGTSQKYDH